MRFFPLESGCADKKTFATVAIPLELRAMPEDKRKWVNFVCTANICRSPMAEYLFEKELEKRANKDRYWLPFKGVSSGVSASMGEFISPNSLEALQELGIDASVHRSRMLTQELLDRSCAVFCMTSTHKLLIEMRYDVLPGKVHLLRDFMPGKVAREVPDPFGADIGEYRLCRQAIAEAMPSVFDYLKRGV